MCPMRHTAARTARRSSAPARVTRVRVGVIASPARHAPRPIQWRNFSNGVMKLIVRVGPRGSPGARRSSSPTKFTRSSAQLPSPAEPIPAPTWLTTRCRRPGIVRGDRSWERTQFANRATGRNPTSFGAATAGATCVPSMPYTCTNRSRCSGAARSANRKVSRVTHTAATHLDRFTTRRTVTSSSASRPVITSMLPRTVSVTSSPAAPGNGISAISPPTTGTATPAMAARSISACWITVAIRPIRSRTVNRRNPLTNGWSSLRCILVCGNSDT